MAKPQAQPEEFHLETTATNTQDVHHSTLADKLHVDGDQALEVLHTQAIDYTPEEERRLRWKIDLHLVPLMVLVNGIQFVDKLTVAFAGTFGISTEAHLVGQEYSLLTTLFYIGYLVAQYPTGLLMQRFPTGKYLTVNFVLWGAVLTCTGAAKSFPALAACRFFLGVFESCLNPGFVLVSGSWWKREEQAARIGLWYSANGLAGVPAGVIFWAIAHINVDGMFPYQWMFIISGAFTVLIGGGVVWWFLPDSPMTCTWLNDRERLIAIQRLASNRTGIKNATHKKEQVLETLKDYRVWMLVFAVFCHNMTNSLQTTFTGLILEGFGYGTYEAILLQMPGGAIMAVTTIIVTSFLSTRWGEGKRIIAIICCYFPGIIACAMLYSIPITAHTLSSHLAAVFLVTMIAAAGGVMYVILAANIAGYTKKTTAGALFFSSYCVANIISPQTFLASQKPRYETGVAVSLAAIATNIILFGTLYFVYRRENKARDRDADSYGGDGDVDQASDLANAFSDLTDRQNKMLRYKL